MGLGARPAPERKGTDRLCTLGGLDSNQCRGAKVSGRRGADGKGTIISAPLCRSAVRVTSGNQIEEICRMALHRRPPKFQQTRIRGRKAARPPQPVNGHAVVPRLRQLCLQRRDPDPINLVQITIAPNRISADHLRRSG